MNTHHSNINTVPQSHTATGIGNVGDSGSKFNTGKLLPGRPSEVFVALDRLEKTVNSLMQQESSLRCELSPILAAGAIGNAASGGPPEDTSLVVPLAARIEELDRQVQLVVSMLTQTLAAIRL